MLVQVHASVCKWRALGADMMGAHSYTLQSNIAMASVMHNVRDVGVAKRGCVRTRAIAGMVCVCVCVHARASCPSVHCAS
eukprot:7293850-Alexandrium_andersonii.AAC.1